MRRRRTGDQVSRRKILHLDSDRAPASAMVRAGLRHVRTTRQLCTSGQNPLLLLISVPLHFFFGQSKQKTAAVTPPHPTPSATPSPTTSFTYAASSGPGWQALLASMFGARVGKRCARALLRRSGTPCSRAPLSMRLRALSGVSSTGAAHPGWWALAPAVLASGVSVAWYGYTRADADAAEAAEAAETAKAGSSAALHSEDSTRARELVDMLQTCFMVRCAPPASADTHALAKSVLALRHRSRGPLPPPSVAALPF